MAAPAATPEKTDAATVPLAPLVRPPSSRARFPAAARLHRPSEFAPALKGRRLARGAFFMVSHAPNEAGLARLGLVIGKRQAALACQRNALKRVLREAFRAARHRMPPGDYVVRLHSRLSEQSLTALKLAARKEADAHFERICSKRS